MQPSKFLENKIKRQLKINGIEYKFIGVKENEYHELIEDGVETKIKGIYHESNSYESESVADGAVIHSKPQPMILCLWQDALEINVGYKVQYGSKNFEVIAKNDIQDYGIACDISLKEVEENVEQYTF
jgi:hypothetical protein